MTARSKSTEIGELPIDWNVTSLKDVSSMKSGLSITSKKIRDFGPFPCYGGNGLRGFTSTYTHEGDYALIGRQGALCGNIQFASNKFFASEHAVVVTPKKNINIKWLSYVLDRMNLNQYSESSAQPGLSVKKLLQLPIPLPPTNTEQTAIATALSDADALITSLEHLIAKKKAIKQGAIQELMKPREGWVEKNIAEVAIVRDGTHQTPKYVNEGIPFYSVENITADDFKNIKYVSPKEHKFLTKNWKIEKGDILMTRIGSIGICKYVDWNVNASFYVSLALFKVKSGFSAKFIYHYSQYDFFKKELELNSLQFAYPQKINLGQILKVKMIIPKKIEELEKIAQILTDMDAEIALLEKQLEKQKFIKQGMMQVLLTGKVRLL
jgi:type I restriction enzyme S subunit